VRWCTVDGALGEVSGVADYEGEPTAVGVGDGREAVPVAQRSLGYDKVSFILR
jgi:hypothetical protein